MISLYGAVTNSNQVWAKVAFDFLIEQFVKALKYGCSGTGNIANVFEKKSRLFWGTLRILEKVLEEPNTTFLMSVSDKGPFMEDNL